MRAQLRKTWQARAPRERSIIAALAVMLGAVLYVWLVQSAGQARAQLSASVATLRTQAVRIEQQSAEFGLLRAAPPATVSPTDLLTLVQGRIGDAGLAHALVSINALNAEQVVVVFGAVAFADWIQWIAGLKSQHIRLDACRIEALSTAGLVSVTATLVRAKQQ